MHISCVAFGCRNKQSCSKNRENPCEEVKYVSCDKGLKKEFILYFIGTVTNVK